MTNEMPATNNAVDLLAERYRAAFDKTDHTQKQSQIARADWIEATLELGEVILQASNQYPDNNDFSRWLGRNGLQMTTPAERTALRGFARDPEAGRKLLQDSTSYSWRGIYEKVPKREQRAPSGSGKGPSAAHSRRSGSAKRQRAQRIPDVMQDKPRPLEAVHLKGLTREQVDPDFKGNAIEFAAKYGPVTLHTKAEIEQDKRAAAAAKWVGEVTAHARTADAITARPEGVAEWLAKPGKAARLKGLLDSIRRAAERLEPEEQIATNPDLLDECPRLN